MSSIGAAGFSQTNKTAEKNKTGQGINLFNAAAFISYDRAANRNATLLAQNADISENADEEIDLQVSFIEEESKLDI